MPAHRRAVGRAIVLSKGKAKSVLGVMRGQPGRAGEMANGILCAARSALAIFIAKVEAVGVFVADRRGRRGEEADQNTCHDEPGSDY